MLLLLSASGGVARCGGLPALLWLLVVLCLLLLVPPPASWSSCAAVVSAQSPASAASPRDRLAALHRQREAQKRIKQTEREEFVRRQQEQQDSIRREREASQQSTHAQQQQQHDDDDDDTATQQQTTVEQEVEAAATSAGADSAGASASFANLSSQHNNHTDSALAQLTAERLTDEHSDDNSAEQTALDTGAGWGREQHQQQPNDTEEQTALMDAAEGLDVAGQSDEANQSSRQQQQHQHESVVDTAATQATVNNSQPSQGGHTEPTTEEQHAPADDYRNDTEQHQHIQHNQHTDVPSTDLPQADTAVQDGYDTADSQQQLPPDEQQAGINATELAASSKADSVDPVAQSTAGAAKERVQHQHQQQQQQQPWQAEEREKRRLSSRLAPHSRNRLSSRHIRLNLHCPLTASSQPSLEAAAVTDQSAPAAPSVTSTSPTRSTAAVSVRRPLADWSLVVVRSIPRLVHRPHLAPHSAAALPPHTAAREDRQQHQPTKANRSAGRRR